MKNHPLIFVIVAILLALVAMVYFRPTWLSDDNDFLKNFVNHEYLNVLGVIFVISLASLSQVHIRLNQIEEHRQQECFQGTRKEIRQSAYGLIVLFALAFVIVVAKPLFCETQTSTAIVNAIAVFILAMFVLFLLDITIAVFDLKPIIKPPSKDDHKEQKGKPLKLGMDEGKGPGKIKRNKLK